MLSLKLKIITGYVVIVLLFLALLIMAYYESRRILAVDSRSELLFAQRKLAENITMQILDLSLLSEQVLVWNEENIAAYQKEYEQVIASLSELQKQLEENKQNQRIASIISLLSVKRELTFAMVNDVEVLHSTDTIIAKRLPAIIQQTKHDKQNLARQIENNYTVKEKKKRGFFGLFTNKRKVNEQILKNNDATLKQNQALSGVLLRSLVKEIGIARKESRDQLSSRVDSLNRQNIYLNNEISRLIRGFNIDEQNHRKEKAEIYLIEQERSLRIISCLGFFAITLSIVFYVILHRDLRKRHRYRLQLEESNRRNGELLRARKNMMLTISHDLRTPLTSIRGCTELLFNEKFKEKRSHLCQTILQSSDNMASLLNTLLNFYRLDIGKEQSYPMPFRIKSLVEKLDAEFHPLADKAELTFKVEYDGEDVIVTGDRERILQIVRNLLSNAIKFTTEGDVFLFIAYKRNMLTLKVSDTGTGMTQEQTKRIFQPFERLENAEAREGFGLGLAISQGFTALLNGRIEVQSKLGKGSVFLVHIPLSASEEQLSKPKINSICHLPAGLKILVIDDDDITLAMTQNMLSFHKIRCDTCRNIQELTERMRQDEYDLLITDIRMPNMSGYDVLELLRTSDIGNSRTISVIALTAHEECREDGFTSAGFAGCLYKPFSMSELLSAVQRCIKVKLDSPEVKVDFSKMLSEESDKKGMLELLIRDTDRSMEVLLGCVKEENLDSAFLLVHRLLPLWEILHIESSLRELYDLLSNNPDIQDNRIQPALDKVLITGKVLCKHAEEKMEEGVYE